MIQVLYIKPEHLHSVWDGVKEHLERGLERSAGEYSVDQLKVFLVQGSQHLLIGVDENKVIQGAVTVEFLNMPNDRIAFATTFGGKMVANKEVWDQFISWCKHNGATKFRAATFESGARLYRKAFGTENRYIMVEKTL